MPDLAPTARAAPVSQSLDALPRVPLGCYPTPLQHMDTLSSALHHELYLKRDDALGPVMGGNKTRKLEYELGFAKTQKARKVVTFGGLQSNHARLTAGAAISLGFEPHLLYFARRPALPQGNLLLNQLLGAHMHFVPFGKGGDGTATLESTNRLVHLVALALVGPHYFIPVGGHSVRGALGYVRAAFELDTQAQALDIPNARVIVAAGTGGTLAGLMAGFYLCRSRLNLLGLDIGRLWKNFPNSIAQLASALCAFLGQPHEFDVKSVPLIEHRYVGAAYAILTAEGNQAVRTLARAEGIFLDPVYTGKAFAGMLDLLQRGDLGTDQPIIFLHTGGTPALFAFADQLRSESSLPNLQPQIFHPTLSS